MNSNRKTIVHFFKAIILFALLQLTTINGLLAQQIIGVYLSNKDFDANKTSYTKEKNNKCKIKLHHDNYKPYIEIKRRDTSLLLLKDSVFGYKNMEGISFRFFKKQVYQIINQGEHILLYKTEIKTGSIKEQKTIIHYFFSNGSSGEIFELTIPNLELCFKENIAFTEFLEVHFKNDDDLIEYDDKHKMYKLNRLLKLSFTHKTN